MTEEKIIQEFILKNDRGDKKLFNSRNKPK